MIILITLWLYNKSLWKMNENGPVKDEQYMMI